VTDSEVDVQGFLVNRLSIFSDTTVAKATTLLSACLTVSTVATLSQCRSGMRCKRVLYLAFVGAIAAAWSERLSRTPNPRTSS
jgi:hypothetical protein